MKAILFIATVGVFFRSLSAEYLPVSVDANGFFHLNSGQSTYVGYAPTTYNEATPISLLVWLHGCGGYAEADLWTVAPQETRETQSYIAIAIGGRDGSCWSVSTDGPKVLAAVSDLARYFNINPKKVYLSGYSSGGDLAYRVGLQNASTFAALLVENSDPFLGTGLNASSAAASASWKIHIAHLAHLSDAVYPITTIRSNLAALVANGFPVTQIERPGTHYDPNGSSFGTTYDLIHYLLPVIDSGLERPTPVISLTLDTAQGVILTVTEPPGGLCIVTATTDLLAPNWSPVATGRVPFTFTAEGPGAYEQRFFRAALAP